MFADIILKNNFVIEGLTIYADSTLVCQDHVILLGRTKLVLKKNQNSSCCVVYVGGGSSSALTWGGGGRQQRTAQPAQLTDAR